MFPVLWFLVSRNRHRYRFPIPVLVLVRGRLGEVSLPKPGTAYLICLLNPARLNGQ